MAINQTFNDVDNRIVMSLASEYSCVFHYDISKDIISVFSMNDHYRTVFENSLNHIGIKAAVNLYLKCVHEDDRDMFAGHLSLPRILVSLSRQPVYRLEYRNDRNQYCECKISYLQGSTDELVIGMANVDSVIRGRKELEKRQNRDYQIIDALTLEYDGVNYVDALTGKFLNFRAFDELDDSFKALRSSPMTYDEMNVLYAREYVVPEDYDMYVEKCSMSAVCETLRNRKYFSFLYRLTLHDELRFGSVTFVKTGDESEEVTSFVVGYSYDDDMILENYIHSSLTNEFESIYYCDLSANIVRAYKDSESTVLGRFDTAPYDIVIKSFATDVSPTQRKMWERFANRDFLNDYFAHEDIREFTYQLMNENAANSWRRSVWQVLERENGNPKTMVVTFMKMDSASSRENINRIMTLADEYEFIYDVDYVTGKYSVFFKSEDDHSLVNIGSKSESYFYDNLIKWVDKKVWPEDKEMMRAVLSKDRIADVLSRDISYSQDFRMADGEHPVWYQAKFVRYGDWENEPRFILGIMNNDSYLSKVKEYQVQLQQALVQARSANRAKTSFLNNMSHDIRTPMNAIIGFGSMAMKNISDTEKVRDCLGKIGTSSEHLMALINDVLDMSRIESGKLSLTEHAECMGDIISTLCDIISPDAEAKNISCYVNYKSVQNDHIICDKVQLSRALLNLLTNAVLYTNPGGSISFNVSRTEVSHLGYARYEFNISDTGIGMGSEFVKTIFDPFTREHSSTQSGVQGAGLGLAITKNIIDMMGGTIEVSSILGEGSEFLVALEFKMVTEMQESEENMFSVSDVPIFDGERVLVFEDNELNREIAEEMLTDMGLKVDMAENGEIGVSMLKASTKHPYDIVLMDIQMPVMDGYEATQAIRMLSDVTLSEIPIIAMTANAFEEDRRAALLAGMNEHIAKPVDPRIVRRVLAKYLLK